MKKIKLFFVAVLSAGWLWPLYGAFDSYRSFLITELEPMIKGQPITHSYGMLDGCGICFTISILWLGCAIVFWVVRAMRIEGKKTSESEMR